MKRRTLIPLLWCLLACLPFSLRAQSPQAVPEYTMKAAYLYNFALLTTWPVASNASGSDFHLCVYGQDDLGPAMERLNGKDVNGQKIHVLHIDNSPDAARECQLIFISETNAARVARLVNALGDKPVLTVADDNLSRLAMISLTPENKRLTFTINANAAKSAKLQLSSKLLRLAANVVAP